jgi:hypothetical protein
MTKSKTDSNYFTQDTENAIVTYNNSTDSSYKDKLFRERIYYPFYKLVENIIHTFKFYYTDVDDIEDLKLEIISLLVEEKMHLFDPSNGAKAYSYFGTIIKRHLINYNNKNYKKVKNTLGIETVEDTYEIDLKDRHPEAISLTQFIDVYVEKMYEQLKTLFPRETERQIAGAVLNLFEKRYDLELFKKKALYIYIREMTGTNTPYLTKVINVLKEEFYKMYNTYNEIGKIYIK